LVLDRGLQPMGDKKLPDSFGCLVNDGAASGSVPS